MTARRHGSAEATVRVDGREALFVGVLAAGISLVFVLLSWANGTWGIPQIDDWAYFRVAERLQRSGTFALDGWTQTFLLGHAVLAVPAIWLAGGSFVGAQIWVAVLGGLTLCLAYGVSRFLLPMGWSLLAAGCLLINPSFGDLATSFMTDVPSACVVLAALGLGMLATVVRATRVVPLCIASGTLALLAFTIREASGAVLVASLLPVIGRWDRLGAAWRATAVLAGAVWVVAAAALFWWRSGLEYSIGTVLRLEPQDLAGSVSTLVTGTTSLAYSVFPSAAAIAFWLSWPALSGGRRLMALALTALWLLLVGGRFATNGSVSSFESPLDALVTLLATATVVLTVTLALSVWPRSRLAAARRWVTDARSWCAAPRSVLITFVATTVVAMVVGVLLTEAQLFDRYLFVLIPTVATLVLASARRRGVVTRVSRGMAVASLGVLALVSLWQVDVWAAKNGAVWAAAQEAVQRGLAPDRIAAGIAWWGTQHNEPTFYDGPSETGEQWYVTADPPVPVWYLALFGPKPICALAADGPEGVGSVSSEAQPWFTTERRSLFGITFAVDMWAVPGCVIDQWRGLVPPVPRGSLPSSLDFGGG